MFDRIARSVELARASSRVLASDKELVVFPVLSGMASLLVVASFLGPAMGLDLMEQDPGPLAWVLIFLFYLCQYFVILFFNSALVAAALIRLQGGDPTVKDGLAAAWDSAGAIFGYAVIAATVGLLLRMIEQKAGWIGRIIAAGLGLAWSAAAFLVVPVLVSQHVGPVDAVKESVAMLKKTWGENIVGQGGIAFVFGLASVGVAMGGITLFIVLSAVSQALAVGALVLAGAAMLGLGILQAALTGVYSAALYQHAMGEVVPGFERGDLDAAFDVK